MKITIDINKAKEIGHTIRRDKRAEEFAPYDEVISKQIPGADFQAAEVARQEIRARYAKIQKAIDSASTPEEIKQALSLE